ncbi:hypothetical protein P691DRAFT_661738 [Macrolepiota fuliginosa MF-IS2]|uniref:F-box domain-containing protein n=1 Tax=Macrolepiota fuliginosa MF-IS2 TaxID=1400762 RepID=A0A9P6C8F7_9AGAR|nr:hypothetical protein P691DRAFT_661738 [Macrolepiota fuliginosa MF-IS2]
MATIAKVAGFAFLDLPPETVTHILLHLPFTSVVTCKGVNRHLQILISESAELQYHIHLGIYRLVDNPHCHLPVSERLSQLLARECRWEKLDFDFDRTINIPIPDLWAGSRLSGSVFSILYDGGVLYEMQIPNEADQETVWNKAHPEQLVETISVYEQDLHVLITAQPRTVLTNEAGPRTIHEIRFHISRLSTGEPHPDSQQVISFETREEFGMLWAVMECAGDNLVLVLRDDEGVHPNDAGAHGPDDQVYVYEWKTGKLKMLSAPFGSYHYPLILTSHIFLLPNTRTGELEYWRIPQNLSEPTSGQPFFILSLPRLCLNKFFGHIFCRAEYNPSIGPCITSKPFYTNPHHAIVIFHVTIQMTDFPLDLTSLTFFVHRSSLVGCLDKFSAFMSSDERPNSVPYDDWGVHVCRWLEPADFPLHVLPSTFGQRYVTSPKWMEPLTLLDFNPLGVKRALTTEKHHDLIYEPQFHAQAIIQTLDSLGDPHHCFEHTVYSSLPYTVRSSHNEYYFDRLFMDEECILGFQVPTHLLAVFTWTNITHAPQRGDWNRMNRVRVLHCG